MKIRTKTILQPDVCAKRFVCKNVNSNKCDVKKNECNNFELRVIE